MWHFSSTNFFGKTFVSVQCIVLRTLTSSILKLFREEWKENCDWNSFWSLLIWMHPRWLCNLTSMSVCVTNSWMINENSHKKKCLDNIQFVWSVYARTMEGSKQNCQMDYSFFFKILFVTATHCYIFKKKRNTVFVMERKKRDETHMEFFKLYNSNEKQDINEI